MPAPLTPEQRQQCLDLHEFGLTRVEISKALGISDAAVTSVLTSADRAVAQTQPGGSTSFLSPKAPAGGDDVVVGSLGTELMGTVERLKRLESRRLLVAEMAIEASRKTIEELEKPYVAYSFGGQFNEYREEVLDHVPVAARRDLSVASVNFAKLSVEAIKGDGSNTDTSDLDVWLQGMGS